MHKLEIGRRFRKLTAPSIVWEIVGHRIDREGIPHVRLVSMHDHTRVILLAASVVESRDRFTEVRSEAAHQSAGTGP